MQRVPDDITHLYEQFGGKPQSYQELTRTREADKARERWPLIARVHEVPADTAVPPVQAGEALPASPLRWQGVPPVTPVPPAPPRPTMQADAAAAATPLGDPAPADLPASEEALVQPPQTRPAISSSPARASQAGDTARASAPLFDALRNPPKAQPSAPPLFAPQPRSTGPEPAAGAVPAWRRPGAPQPHAGPAPADPSAPAPRDSAQAHGATATAARSSLPEALAGNGLSPLARLAQAPAALPPRAGNLRNLFARLLGRGNS